MQYGAARDLQIMYFTELILIVKCLAIADQKCSIMHAEHIHVPQHSYSYRVHV